ncbi:MAG: EF-P lysine aminoacylase EpmA [Pseudomonadota bacterium]
MRWRPLNGPAVAAERARLKRRVHQYFQQQSVLEVDTPSLSASAVSDPHLHSFTVEDRQHAATPLYLHTSPEFAMKRLLAAGFPDIYSVCRVYRGGEVGHRHQPEFTMIEWYRAGMREHEIVEDTLALIGAVLDRETAIVQKTYRDAFVDAIGLDPLTDPLETIKTAAGFDSDLAASLGDRRQDWLDVLFADRVASTFEDDTLTVINAYPADQAALAQLDPNDPAVALRFEVFAGSMELANGFVELGDADELRQRFESDLEIRRDKHQSVLPLDERFLAAMQSGLPGCAGVALGFERLHMVAADTTDIRDVLLFDHEG